MRFVSWFLVDFAIFCSFNLMISYDVVFEVGFSFTYFKHTHTHTFFLSNSLHVEFMGNYCFVVSFNTEHTFFHFGLCLFIEQRREKKKGKLIICLLFSSSRANLTLVVAWLYSCRSNIFRWSKWRMHQLRQLNTVPIRIIKLLKVNKFQQIVCDLQRVSRFHSFVRFTSLPLYLSNPFNFLAFILI